MATKPATAAAEQPAQEVEADANVLDTQSAAVKRLIAKGKERGYITFDELNAVLPAEQNSSEQIEDIMAMLSEMGIQVVESEEGEDPEATSLAKEEVADDEDSPAGNVSESSVSRTDDPVRMYLREMGTVELLSREGEIAIAKRIEAGRDMMIRGLCESPLTFRAIIAWHEALNNGRVLLRDVIDLEAMEAGSEPGATEAFEATEELDEDEEGEGAGMSLAALEEKLKPEIFTHFEDIEKLYDKLAKLQQKRLDNLTAGGDINSRSEKTYEKLRDELVAKVEQVRLHNNRIEELVAQLKVLNQRLNGLEGQILRLAESAKVTREEFLQHYRGREMDPNWMHDIGELPGKGWKEFAKKFTPQVNELRAQIGKVASEGGLPIEEFRRVYTTVSRGERDSTRAKKEMIEANLRLVI
ncbi:RNA polymerase sigma factor region1.1 domain-containing protein, partial [Acidocella sp.]|uniref:RNA polymerase sigma factor region1.1 domain-containing protein n=1 Tax=Acidocella sp. TaxID=50710 RepID=UPI002F3FA54C